MQVPDGGSDCELAGKRCLGSPLCGNQTGRFVHPLALRALQEIGIDATHARSKSVDEFRGQDFDLVVTVCDQASEECPLWLGAGETLSHWIP